jgi:hypothetical protein
MFKKYKANDIESNIEKSIRVVENCILSISMIRKIIKRTSCILMNLEIVFIYFAENLHICFVLVRIRINLYPEYLNIRN